MFCAGMICDELKNEQLGRYTSLLSLINIKYHPSVLCPSIALLIVLSYFYQTLMVTYLNKHARELKSIAYLLPSFRYNDIFFLHITQPKHFFFSQNFFYIATLYLSQGTPFGVSVFYKRNTNTSTNVPPGYFVRQVALLFIFCNSFFLPTYCIHFYSFLLAWVAFRSRNQETKRSASCRHTGAYLHTIRSHRCTTHETCYLISIIQYPLSFIHSEMGYPKHAAFSWALKIMVPFSKPSFCTTQWAVRPWMILQLETWNSTLFR